MRTITAENLKINKVVLNAFGALSGGKFSINYSDILTKLIQECGRWVENYASDLFIDWSSLERRLENPVYTGEKLAFGFRKSGVDSMEYIITKYNEPCYKHNSDYYRAIWVLDIHVEEVEYSWKKEIKMQLGKINL